MGKASRDGAPPVRVYAPTHGTRFDTRLLDRIESFAGQYRYWLNYSADDLPQGYIESQREAYRMELRNAARELAERLAADQAYDEAMRNGGD